MRRRQLLAGAASVAAVGGAGLFATGHAPSVFGEDAEPIEPMTIQTIEAPGSREGEVTIPASDQPTFVDFFGTWCPPCIEQMPALGDAHERVGEEVRFISVTTEAVGRSVTEAEIAEWWVEHDGSWLVGADPTAELAARVNVGSYPTAVVFDDAGRIQWSDSGVHTADELTERIEAVLE